MRAFFVVVVSTVALGGCTQDENASNSERDTHMGEVRAAATATPTAPPTTTPTPTASPSASAVR